MAGAIQFTGLGSGIDTKAIVDALVAAERVSQTQLEDRRTDAQQKISLIGTFKSLVSALHDKAADLGKLSKLQAFKVGSSNADFASFSVTSSAQAGSHSLVVESLASTDRWAFDGVADPDADLASADGQMVSFTYNGANYTATVNAATSSLTEIAQAINTATNGEVKASVVNSGPTSSPSWQLVLTAKDSGADFRISAITNTIAGLTIDATGPTGNTPGSTNNLTVGTNAVATIDGLRVERDSNDFSDVLAGVGITLQRADVNTTTTFTVEPDKDAIKSKLAGFVSAYNSVVLFANKQNSYDSDTGPGGPLFGDSTLRRVSGILRSSLFGQTAAQVGLDTEGFGTLRLLGIQATSDGTLTIDDSQMDEKMNANLDAFLDFFADTDGFDNGGAAAGTPGYYVDLSADTGFGDDLARALDAATQSYDDGAGHLYDGVFDARTKALRQEIDNYDKRIDEQERRLTQMQEDLTARFAALESLMGSLNSQGQFLAQSLASLGNG